MTDSVRIDIWLWRARFFKTRSQSATFAASGHLRLERFGQVSRVDKAGHAVKPGDRLIFAIGTRLFDVDIVDSGERRGPAAEARTLYISRDTPPDKPG